MVCDLRKILLWIPSRQFPIDATKKYGGVSEILQMTEERVLVDATKKCSQLVQSIEQLVFVRNTNLELNQPSTSLAVTRNRTKIEIARSFRKKLKFMAAVYVISDAEQSPWIDNPTWFYYRYRASRPRGVSRANRASRRRRVFVRDD